MRILITGGDGGDAAGIAAALSASGYHIAARDAPFDLHLTLAPGTPEPLEVGGVSIDLRRQRVERQGQSIWLTNAEYALLAYLAQAERPVGRDELLRELWRCAHDPETNLVAVHVSRLRRKVGPGVILTHADGYTVGPSVARRQAPALGLTRPGEPAPELT